MDTIYDLVASDLVDANGLIQASSRIKSPLMCDNCVRSVGCDLGQPCQACQPSDIHSCTYNRAYHYLQAVVKSQAANVALSQRHSDALRRFLAKGHTIPNTPMLRPRAISLATWQSVVTEVPNLGLENWVYESGILRETTRGHVHLRCDQCPDEDACDRHEICRMCAGTGQQCTYDRAVRYLVAVRKTKAAGQRLMRRQLAALGTSLGQALPPLGYVLSNLDADLLESGIPPLYRQGQAIGPSGPSASETSQVFRPLPPPPPQANWASDPSTSGTREVFHRLPPPPPQANWASDPSTSRTREVFHPLPPPPPQANQASIAARPDGPMPPHIEASMRALDLPRPRR